MHCKLCHLADTGHTGDHQCVVAVTLHSCLTEEQVNLVVISILTLLTLWHLSHGNKCGLWDRKKKKHNSVSANKQISWQFTSETTETMTMTSKTAYYYILPLSQELLNSVRMMLEELRIRTGSEPRKFIEVAEYRVLSGETRQQVNTLLY